MSTPRRLPGALFATSLLALALGACGVAVSPNDRDGGSADARPDGRVSSDTPDVPPGCVLPDGTRVPVGASITAPDGCNTCACGPDGSLACTGLACVDAGVDARVDAPHDGPLLGACVLSSECRPSEICVAPPGCGTPGSCQPAPGCTDDLALYCMCDGTTVSGSGSCPPGIFRHRGPCEIPTVDAGADTGSDASADTGTPPGSVDCNSNFVLCNAVRPVCPAGTTNSVERSCWGPCVPIAACMRVFCTPMAAEAAGDRAAPRPAMCPQNMYCDPRNSYCIEDAPGG